MPTTTTTTMITYLQLKKRLGKCYYLSSTDDVGSKWFFFLVSFHQINQSMKSEWNWNDGIFFLHTFFDSKFFFITIIIMMMPLGLILAAKFFFSYYLFGWLTTTVIECMWVCVCMNDEFKQTHPIQSLKLFFFGWLQRWIKSFFFCSTYL